ncbi:MAG TPA: 23S rRNA (pseudouridine(1915)-N(3))-methyltransferase RlmH [Deinococcales bacterium]|nr:23S rRNA (pseudouridine(1915)-N(3))-methyltransferase RlmH [Deinococcales bacterium]
MRIHLVAVGTKMPAWVAAGFGEYAGRLPRSCSLVLKEVTPARRRRGENPAGFKKVEASRIAAALPRGVHRVGLEVGGREHSTEQLSGRLAAWLGGGRDVALLVGGPDGLDPELSRSCDEHWSLSRLTLPHPLVRVIVAEQLYRAHSLLRGHPYHRA